MNRAHLDYLRYLYLDGSPTSFTTPSKRSTTKADKQDDLLLEEFKSLQPVDASHLEELPSPKTG